MRRSHQNYQTTAFERRDAGPAEVLRSIIGRVGNPQTSTRGRVYRGAMEVSPGDGVRRVTPDRSGGSRRILFPVAGMAL